MPSSLKNLLPGEVEGMSLGCGHTVLISSSPSTVLSRPTFCERFAQQEKGHQLMFQFMTSEDYFANHFTFPHKCYSSGDIFYVIGVCSLSSSLCLFYLCMALSALHLQSVFTQQVFCLCLWSSEGQCDKKKGHSHVYFEFRYMFCHLPGNWAI